MEKTYTSDAGQHWENLGPSSASYTNRKGEAVAYDLWRSHCIQCGAPFTTLYSPRRKPGILWGRNFNRRKCDACK
jgi:hypothetical protein